MAGKRAHDAEIEATNGVYKLAREHADQEMAKLRGEMDSIRQEAYTMGAIKAFETNIAQNEFLKIMALYNIKMAKDYKTGGLTWAQFCDEVGVPQRTADRMIEEAKPYFELFSAGVAKISGVPFNKIRMLGKAFSASEAEIKDNCLVYGDETIPLTPEYRDDIQALIERIGEEAKAAKEDAEADIRAKDKVLKSKEDVIRKQERELARFEKAVAAKGLSPEEDALLAKIEEMRVIFNGSCRKLDNVMAALRDNPFPSACAEIISLFDYIKMRICADREVVAGELAPSGMIPEEEWQPPVRG